MFSVRFSRPVVITRHARIRMVEREISEVTLLDVIDNGDSAYDALWHDPGVLEAEGESAQQETGPKTRPRRGVSPTSAAHRRHV